jgi:hypothetical protein
MIPIEVRSKSDCAESDVRQFAEHRLSFALDRLRNLRRIVISNEDVNGPKGGVDKRCRIIAEFGFAFVAIEDTQPTWQGAVARAIRRAARRAVRALQRANEMPSHKVHRTPLKTLSIQSEAS